MRGCCISFDSYIKPQQLRRLHLIKLGCISFDSYIKPQPIRLKGRLNPVVYLLIPTSNHNRDCRGYIRLCVVYLLIPTSNHNVLCVGVVVEGLYIFWFLHQTTTIKRIIYVGERCISFDSYIKPQLYAQEYKHLPVVYLLIPTSNHNKFPKALPQASLYIFWFLHQTTTYDI